MRLLTAKEMLFVVNLPAREYLSVIEQGIDERPARPNWMRSARETVVARYGDSLVLPFSAEYEEKLDWIAASGPASLNQ